MIWDALTLMWRCNVVIGAMISPNWLSLRCNSAQRNTRPPISSEAPDEVTGAVFLPDNIHFSLHKVVAMQFLVEHYCILTQLPLKFVHWGRVVHICVNKLTIIGSDDVLSPGRRQDIIWTSASILIIGPLGTNFNKILIEIYAFLFKKIYLKNAVRKMSAILSLPQCIDFHDALWLYQTTQW